MSKNMQCLTFALHTILNSVLYTDKENTNEINITFSKSGKLMGTKIDSSPHKRHGSQSIQIL